MRCTNKGADKKKRTRTSRVDTCVRSTARSHHTKNNNSSLIVDSSWIVERHQAAASQTHSHWPLCEKHCIRVHTAATPSALGIVESTIYFETIKCATVSLVRFSCSSTANRMPSVAFINRVADVVPTIDAQVSFEKCYRFAQSVREKKINDFVILSFFARMRNIRRKIKVIGLDWNRAMSIEKQQKNIRMEKLFFFRSGNCWF